MGGEGEILRLLAKMSTRRCLCRLRPTRNCDAIQMPPRAATKNGDGCSGGRNNRAASEARAHCTVASLINGRRGAGRRRKEIRYPAERVLAQLGGRAICFLRSLIPGSSAARRPHKERIAGGGNFLIAEECDTFFGKSGSSCKMHCAGPAAGGEGRTARKRRL